MYFAMSGVFLPRCAVRVWCQCWAAVPVPAGHQRRHVHLEHRLPPLHHLHVPHPPLHGRLVPAPVQARHILHSILNIYE